MLLAERSIVQGDFLKFQEEAACQGCSLGNTIHGILIMRCENTHNRNVITLSKQEGRLFINRRGEDGTLPNKQ